MNDCNYWVERKSSLWSYKLVLEADLLTLNREIKGLADVCIAYACHNELLLGHYIRLANIKFTIVLAIF